MAPDRPVIDRLSGAASVPDGQAERPTCRMSPHGFRDALSRGCPAGMQLSGQRMPGVLRTDRTLSGDQRSC
jgi:hypothetical protein